VAAKLKQKYRAAPAFAEATRLIWDKLRLVVEDGTGELIVVEAHPPSDRISACDKRWLRPHDQITGVWRTHGVVRLGSIEELALELAGAAPGSTIELDCERRYYTGSWTNAIVDVPVQPVKAARGRARR
jgi:hypothetical protein